MVSLWREADAMVSLLGASLHPLFPLMASSLIIYFERVSKQVDKSYFIARQNCKIVPRKPSHRVKFESRTFESESKSES